MVKMTASKRLTYGTRRLKPGDEFDATKRNARVLSAIGKAGYSTRQMGAGDAAPATAVKRKKAPAQTTDDPRPALRAEYKRVLGKNPFNGWSADQLRQKIAEAKG